MGYSVAPVSVRWRASYTAASSLVTMSELYRCDLEAWSRRGARRLRLLPLEPSKIRVFSAAAPIVRPWSVATGLKPWAGCLPGNRFAGGSKVDVMYLHVAVSIGNSVGLASTTDASPTVRRMDRLDRSISWRGLPPPPFPERCPRSLRPLARGQESPDGQRLLCSLL